MPAPTFVADHAAKWPRSGRIVFQVTRGEGGLIVGQSEHRWQHDGASYEITALTETVGLAALFHPAQVTQQSRGSFDAYGLRPLAFEARRADKIKDRISFDPASQQVLLGSGKLAELIPGAQDLLSVFYQLAAVPPEVEGFDLAIAQGRRIMVYKVALVAVGKLATPLGERDVRHYRISAGAKEDSTEVWLDAQLRLPLKIRHRDRKGELFDQMVTQLEVKEIS